MATQKGTEAVDGGQCVMKKKRFLDLLRTKRPFSMEEDFLGIVSAIQHGILVPVLGPSVNPAVYVDLAARLVELTAGAKFANDPKQEGDFVRTYIGWPQSICPFPPALRPSTCPTSAGDSSLFDEQTLSVAKTNCRSLSRLYEIREGTPNLYTMVGECISQTSERQASEIYHVFARLFMDWPALSATREPGQARDRATTQQLTLPVPLIISSNCDTGLEHAFDSRQIPYDLVWCVAGGEDNPKRGKWMHMPYGASKALVITSRSRDCASFPIGSPFNRSLPGVPPRVIILKIFGTINNYDYSRNLQVGDDYWMITQDQMEFFLSAAFDAIDDSLRFLVRGAKLLFLGFSPNDPDLAPSSFACLARIV